MPMYTLCHCCFSQLVISMLLTETEIAIASAIEATQMRRTSKRSDPRPGESETVVTEGTEVTEAKVVAASSPVEAVGRPTLAQS
jgi:hypothetical protein